MNSRSLGWHFAGLMAFSTLACGDRPAPETEAETAAPTPEVEAHGSGLLNPNLASAEELAGIQGLTLEIAEALVDGRPYLGANEFHSALMAQIGQNAGSIYDEVWVPINLNDVTDEEILLIPGIGDRMLHEFEEYRPYAGMAEFEREMGKYVDEDEVARMAQYVFVPIDLNTASREDILRVPGVGERMAHEFEEYRPYENMEQFRREMGKYVDDGEVARLERYVIIR